ncbi:MAG: translocation/assembly module TamB, partial [Marinobacter alexandrii]
MTEQHEPGGPDQQGQDTSAQDKARRSGWFWLLVALAVLILLPVVLMVAILLALRSETGTAWVIDQVPGLEVTEGRGSLLGQWQASEVVWQGFGVNVEVEAVLVDWSPSCLLQTRICLDTLRATRLDVRVQPSAETEETTQGIDLPALELPVRVRVGDVNLGPFSLNGSRVWDRLELSAGGSGADWQLERGVYQLGDYKVTASGRVIT